MEFIPPKIKERLQRLEEENITLKQELAAVTIDSGKKSRTIPLAFVVFILLAVALFQFFKTTQNPSEEIARMKVELWRSGELLDTSFIPSDGLAYSVQIGAYKEMDFKELSRNLQDASVVTKDSLNLLVLGSYSSLPDAQEMLGIVVKLGIENAFIIAQKNGKAVGLLTE
jgi:hypothetical protein